MRRVYKTDIVYATVNDFSADVLREEFDGEPTRADRGFESLIVDEVDHLTLDSCLSMTYLSHQGCNSMGIDDFRCKTGTSSIRGTNCLEL